MLITNKKISHLLNILAILLTSLLIGCSQSPSSSFSSSNSWENFSSQKYGIEIDYPESWVAREYDNGFHGDEEIIAVIFPRTRIFPAIGIALKEMNSPTLLDVENWGEERIMSLYSDSGYELNDSQSILLSNGEETLNRSYITDRSTGLPIMHEDIYIARKNDAIIVTFSATENSYEDLRTGFDHMLSTLKTN